MTRNLPLRLPRSARGPLRVLFVTTSMPVGGAETLLVNLVRSLDRRQILPEIVCLKDPGVLGTALSKEMPVHFGLIDHKYDWRVLGRLHRLLNGRQIDAVITVGAGDKMFWGRLAAWRAGIPVILSALHSTGWPDCITTMNRWLTPITDAFIAVARSHGRFLAEQEKFPASKVAIIPNGVDTNRFCPSREARHAARAAWGIPESSFVCGVVAALRPEKNLSVFVRAAAQFQERHPTARFVIIGDGPERAGLENEASQLGAAISFLGSRPDIDRLLPALDVFTLTSRMEASPVSILEALACEIPVVATNVGSISETLLDQQTGYLVPVDDVAAVVDAWGRLAANLGQRQAMGEMGRNQVLRCGSLDAMVAGYQRLIQRIYDAKCGVAAPAGDFSALPKMELAVTEEVA